MGMRVAEDVDPYKGMRVAEDVAPYNGDAGRPPSVLGMASDPYKKYPTSL